MYGIKLSNLEKKFDENRVCISYDNMEFLKNQVSVLVGPNGSGKTTTFKLILGILDASLGEICFYKNNQVCKRPKIGFFFDDFEPNENLKVKDYIRYRAKLLGLKNNVDVEIKRILEIIEIDADKKIRVLSAGMNKKLALGCALMDNPDIFIFDEPFNSLDPITKDFFVKIINYLRDKKGKTVILSSHDLVGIGEVYDRIYFIKDGRIIDIEDTDKSKAYEYLKEKYNKFYSVDLDKRLELI